MYVSSESCHTLSPPALKVVVLYGVLLSFWYKLIFISGCSVILGAFQTFFTVTDVVVWFIVFVIVCVHSVPFLLSVPLFVEIGDVLRIDTRTGEYMERV